MVSGMSNPVSPGHRLTALIRAAVLVLATQFAVSSAMAHAAHSHEHARGADASAGQAQRLAPELDAVRTVGLQQARIVTASAGAGEGASAAATDCTSHCDGAGIGCCGAVLAPLTIPFAFAARDEIVQFGCDRTAGIQPETLAPPPKALT